MQGYIEIDNTLQGIQVLKHTIILAPSLLYYYFMSRNKDKSDEIPFVFSLNMLVQLKISLNRSV